jgi:hypothetical protein
VLPYGEKLALGLLATSTLEAAPFSACAPFQALLLFFKCILEVVFNEGVPLFRTACDSTSITSNVSK